VRRADARAAHHRNQLGNCADRLTVSVWWPEASDIANGREPLSLPGPRQQPLELVRLGPARDHPLEHVGQPSLRIDTVRREMHQKCTDTVGEVGLGGEGGEA
jgi:hypothetical protein